MTCLLQKQTLYLHSKHQLRVEKGIVCKYFLRLSTQATRHTISPISSTVTCFWYDKHYHSCLNPNKRDITIDLQTFGFVIITWSDFRASLHDWTVSWNSILWPVIILLFSLSLASLGFIHAFEISLREVGPRGIFKLWELTSIDIFNCNSFVVPAKQGCSFDGLMV